MRDLQVLLDNPQESMEVEYKNWLGGLAENQEKAVLAKEIIALSNHGGGFVVIGFNDDNSVLTECEPEVGELDAFSVDSVVSVIHRYVTPAIQVEVQNVSRADSAIEHPVIVVPAAERMPLWAARASPDNGNTLKQNTVYIRRPGGQSAPPQTQDDWERLLERLVLGRISQITDAVRSVIDPRTSIVSVEEEGLDKWIEESYGEWKTITNDLPEGDDRKLPDGHWSVAFHITDFSVNSLTELLQYLSEELQSDQYWNPFSARGTGNRRPRAADNEIVAWLGAEDYQGKVADWYMSRFWRMSAEGYGFSLAPLEEDADYYCSNRRPRPEGPCFDLELPSYRILSTLRFIRLLSERFGSNNSKYTFNISYHNMARRKIECHNTRRWVTGNHVASVSTIESRISGEIESLTTNLEEATYNALRPIYEKFDFYELPRYVVSDSAREMGV